MTTPAISVVYDLHPPSGVSAPGPSSSAKSNPSSTPTNATTTYPVEPSSTSSTSSASETSQYYAALSTSLRQAQGELNEILTVWKDAIGDKEKMKEDPGTPGFGRGKAAMMSEGVMDGAEAVESEDSDEEGEAA